MKHSPLVSFVLVGLCLIGGFVAYRHSSGSQTIFTDLPANALLATTTGFISETIARPTPPPADFVKYENKKYGFYYYHSPEAKVTEYGEGGGPMTIVQENRQRVRGLQIFIVPYAEQTISEERFNKDVPSGVRKNVEDTRLGKLQVRAVTFNSYDQALGETREVWFIHDGYLFEVTTFKGVGDWFAPIMQTWRFI